MKNLSIQSIKNNILAKFSRSKLPKTQIVAFDKILYTQIDDVEKSENSEEKLFYEACKDLGIKEQFNYTMSYISQEDKAFVFLTLYEDLEQKCDFAFAEPLIWRNLNAIQTALPSFYAVFVLKQNYGYVAFFGDKELLYLKNLPQFTLKSLQHKDEAQKSNFIDERICDQSRVKELCVLYQSKVFVFADDALNLSKYLSPRLEIPKFHISIQRTNADLQRNLTLKELKRHDEKINFLHHKADDSLIKKLLFAFCLCFVLGFCVPMSEFFIKQHTLKSSFASEFDEKIPNFDTLQKENSNNALLLKQKRDIIAYISKELKPVLLFDTLEPLFNLLYQKQVKPQSLKISDGEITILIPDDKAGAEFIKELYTNAFFTLKRKEFSNAFYELILERK